LEAKAWYECYEIAQKIIKGEIENPIDDATHYHDISSHPSWADEMKFVCQIDNLKFCK
jgi:spore germination cell wall hydrolase CwlJ-like protein